MILLIDNYDSFTFNLAQLIGAAGEDVSVVRNDSLTAAEALASGARAIVLSPGPGAPESAGICIDLVRAAEQSRTPLFGVCLGLQAIAEGLGGRVIRAGKPMHGKTSAIVHAGSGLFSGVPQRFSATRYHSLVAERVTLPDCLAVTAEDDEAGEIMAVEHRSRPIAGVQFHPESIASEYGAAILRNFLAGALT